MGNAAEAEGVSCEEMGGPNLIHTPERLTAWAYVAPSSHGSRGGAVRAGGAAAPDLSATVNTVRGPLSRTGIETDGVAIESF